MKFASIYLILGFFLENRSEFHFVLSHSSLNTTTIDIYCVSKNQRNMVRRELSKFLFGKFTFCTYDLLEPENNKTIYILRFTSDYE